MKELWKELDDLPNYELPNKHLEFNKNRSPKGGLNTWQDHENS